MKKRTIAYIIVGIIVAIIIAAVTVTLVLVLKKDSKDATTTASASTTTTTPLITTTQGPALDDEISLNSTFPNGSSIIDVNSLGQGSAYDAPLEVNITQLNGLGINIDNSSLVAETGRMSFFYIRLPPFNSTQSSSSIAPSIQTKKIKRAIFDSAYNGNIGIRFGNSSIINVIPLSLASQYDSGLSVIGTMPDLSTIYQLKIRMAESMCMGSSDDTCTVINWTPYSISDSNAGSSGSFNTPLPVACGSQCDAAANSLCATSSCSDCDGETVAGADTPVTRRYKMGHKSGTLLFTYQTYSVPDQITVTYEGLTIFDSGCIGTEDERSKSISYSGNSQELRVDVVPNCDGTTGTAWYFTMPCLSACSASKDNEPTVRLMSGVDEIENGGKAYITKDAAMPPLIAYYCGGDQSATVKWTFKIKYTYTICTKENSDGKTCQTTETRNCDTIIYTGSGPTWNINQILDSVIGGNATLTWEDSQNKNGKIEFQILGTQPSNGDIKNYINRSTTLWYAQYIAEWESSFIQFGGRQPPGYPMHSNDFGYGIFQITRPAPTCEQIWNWQENVEKGIEIINDKVNIANTFMTKQRNQARDYNNGVDIPVPCHPTSHCIFKDGPGNTPIEDAVAIKTYNGANHHYCSWNNDTMCWQFSEKSSDGRNYVELICNEAPQSSATCTAAEQSSHAC